MVDPPFPISHLHQGEQSRIRAGDLSRDELAKIMRGENPWPQYAKDSGTSEQPPAESDKDIRLSVEDNTVTPQEIQLSVADAFDPIRDTPQANRNSESMEPPPTAESLATKTRAADKRIERLAIPDSKEHWFDQGVWNNPLFLGILVMVAFAISFSPKASTLATWSCLFIAWLLATRLIYTRAAKLRHGQIVTAALAAISLLGFVAFGWWLVIPIKATLAESGKSGIPEQKAHQSPTTPPTTEERILIDVKPEYLIGLHKKYSTAQANQAVKTYIGKWVKISGEVADVNQDANWDKLIGRVDPSVMITTKIPADHFYTHCRFEEQRWIDRALVLRRGEKITLRGRITGIDEDSFSLEKCEFGE